MCSMSWGKMCSSIFNLCYVCAAAHTPRHTTHIRLCQTDVTEPEERRTQQWKEKKETTNIWFCSHWVLIFFSFLLAFYLFFFLHFCVWFVLHSVCIDSYHVACLFPLFVSHFYSWLGQYTFRIVYCACCTAATAALSTIWLKNSLLLQYMNEIYIYI